MALSHLAGLPLIPGGAMGIGAMCAVMLRLPFTSVLLATLLLSADGLTVMPLVIVAVVVAYVITACSRRRRRLRRCQQPRRKNVRWASAARMRPATR